MVQPYLFLPRQMLELPEEEEYPLYCLQDDLSRIVVCCTDDDGQRRHEGGCTARGKFVVTVSTSTSSHLPPRRERSRQDGWTVVFDSFVYKIKASGPWSNVAVVLYDSTKRRVSLSQLTLNTWLAGDDTPSSSSSSSSTEKVDGRMRVAAKFMNQLSEADRVSTYTGQVRVVGWLERFLPAEVSQNEAHESAGSSQNGVEAKEQSWKRLFCISLTLAQLYARYCALKQLVSLNNTARSGDDGALQNRALKAGRQMRRLLWQVGIDVLLGALVVVLVVTFPPWSWLDGLFKEYVGLQESQLKTLVVWLNDVPLNFKVNHPLAEFMSKFVHLVLEHWFAFVRFVWPSSTPTLFFILASFGFTVQVGMIADLFLLSSFHLFYSYAATAKLWLITLQSLLALFRLFQGRKQNVLRSRVDKATFTTEQLLVGTSLFSVFLFLFPTLLLFYAVFSALWLVVLTVCAAFRSLVASLNYFPFYGGALCLAQSIFSVESSDLPVGVRFDALESSTLQMKCVPFPASAVFAEFLPGVLEAVGKFPTQRYLWGRLLSPAVPRIHPVYIS